jgi:cysteinyl-tRNA synthetase
MSKSIGNVLLVKDLLEAAPGEVVRLGLLTAHYRQPLDWTAEVLDEAQSKLDRMYGALRAAGIEGAAGDAPAGERPPEAVVDALEDDLNTPRALAELFALAREANRSEDPSRRREIGDTLRAGGRLLGLLQQDPQAWFTRAAPPGGLPAPEVDALVRERESLRRQRRFDEADNIRDRLTREGIVIEDGADGPRWRRAR